jgi:hypothetical protein
MKRRLLAAALLSVLLDPLALWSVAREPRHECRDHVCACRSHCPPRRERSCHGTQDARGLSATCDHDEVPSLGSRAAALLPAATALIAVPRVRVAVEPGPARPDARSTAPDLPPPRAA